MKRPDFQPEIELVDASVDPAKFDSQSEPDGGVPNRPQGGMDVRGKPGGAYCE